MCSYKVLPAALAFACHGPRPPLWASSRERQKPVADQFASSPVHHVQLEMERPCGQLTCGQVLPLAVALAEPILEQSTAGASLGMRPLVEQPKSLAVNVGLQLGAEDDHVEFEFLPLKAALRAGGSDKHTIRRPTASSSDISEPALRTF